MWLEMEKNGSFLFVWSQRLCYCKMVCFFPSLASKTDSGFLGMCNGCLFIYFVMHDYRNTNCADIVKFYKLQSLSLGRDYISFAVEVRGFVCEIVIFSPTWLVKMIAIFGLSDGCLLINLVMHDCKVGNCAGTVVLSYIVSCSHCYGFSKVYKCHCSICNIRIFKIFFDPNLKLLSYVKLMFHVGILNF